MKKIILVLTILAMSSLLGKLNAQGYGLTKEIGKEVIKYAAEKAIEKAVKEVRESIKESRQAQEKYDKEQRENEKGKPRLSEGMSKDDINATLHDPDYR